MSSRLVMIEIRENYLISSKYVGAKLLTPAYLSDYFTRNCSIHAYYARQKKLIYTCQTPGLMWAVEHSGFQVVLF